MGLFLFSGYCHRDRSGLQIDLDGFAATGTTLVGSIKVGLNFSGNIMDGIFHKLAGSGLALELNSPAALQAINHNRVMCSHFFDPIPF